MPRETVTPMEVEKRLLELDEEIGEAQDMLAAAEREYAEADFNNRHAQAEARLRLLAGETRTTEMQRKDEALIQCRRQDWALAQADAKVRAARSNVMRIRAQTDIARSLGTSVRSAMDIL
jgi:uncharacterized protein HemX